MRYHIGFTEQSRHILPSLMSRLYECSFNVSVQTDLEDLPMPWDASWYIPPTDVNPKDVVIISGGAGPSGYGFCQVTVPLKNCPYYVEVEPNEAGQSWFVREGRPQLERLCYRVTEVKE